MDVRIIVGGSAAVVLGLWYLGRYFWRRKWSANEQENETTDSMWPNRLPTDTGLGSKSGFADLVSQFNREVEGVTTSDSLPEPLSEKQIRIFEETFAGDEDEEEKDI